MTKSVVVLLFLDTFNTKSVQKHCHQALPAEGRPEPSENDDEDDDEDGDENDDKDYNENDNKDYNENDD